VRHENGTREVVHGTVTSRFPGTLFSWLRQSWVPEAIQLPDEYDCGFALGWIGYVGYELKRENGRQFMLRFIGPRRFSDLRASSGGDRSSGALHFPSHHVRRHPCPGLRFVACNCAPGCILLRDCGQPPAAPFRHPPTFEARDTCAGYIKRPGRPKIRSPKAIRTKFA